MARQTFKTLSDADRGKFLQAASENSVLSTSAPTLPTSAASSSPEDGDHDAQLEDVDGAELEDGAQDGGQDGAPQLVDVDGVGEFGCSGKSTGDDLGDLLADMLGIIPLSSSRQGSHLDKDEESLAAVHPPPVVRRRIREKRTPLPEDPPPPFVPSSGCSGESTLPSSLPLAPPLPSSDCSDEAMPPPPTPALAPPSDMPPRTPCAPSVLRSLGSSTTQAPSSKLLSESSGVQSLGVEDALTSSDLEDACLLYTSPSPRD